MESKQGQNSPTVFTLEIDQRIVRGFLDNKEATLRELVEAGFTRSAVLDRAGKLGLTGDFLTRHRVNRDDVSVRRCLNCDEVFLSLGLQNRLCNRCRKRQ